MMTEMKLDGNIVNFLPQNVVMVDDGGRLQACFYANNPLEIMRVDDDVPAEQREDVQLVKIGDWRPGVGRSGEQAVKIGSINEIFDLVRMEEPLDSLRKFWEKQVTEYRAQLRKLPISMLDELRKKNGMPAYGIVSRGAAMIMHYYGYSLENLLVPALERPIVMGEGPLAESLQSIEARTGQTMGYQAFMPAKYLLE